MATMLPFPEPLNQHNQYSFQISGDLPPLTIGDPRIVAAINSIVTYPQAALEVIAQAFPRGLELPGTSLGCVEQDVVIAFAKAMNRIAERARSFLASTDPAPVLLEELERERNFELARYTRSTGTVGKPLLLRDFQDHDGDPKNGYQNALQFADRQLVDVMTAIAKGSAVIELQIRGLDLAIMALRAQVANHAVVEGAGKLKESLLTHTTMMQEAFSSAATTAGEKRYPAAKNEFEVAFLTFCDAKLEHTGYIPPLHVRYDLDKTLVPEDNSNLKPGYLIGRIADVLDVIFAIPPWQRLVIGDNLARVPHLPKLAQEMFMHAGKETHKMFEDAAETLQLGQEEHIDAAVLTSNMTQYAKGVLSQRDETAGVAAFGKEPDSFHAMQKDYRTVELFVQDPDGVFLVCDDGDPSLCEAIKRGQALPEGANGPRLSDVAFFAAREAANGEETFRLAKVLRDANVMFGVNKRTIGQDQEIHGFEGAKRLLELYVEWKRERLAEGWPETKLGADAQTEAYKLVSGLDAGMKMIRDNTRRELKLAEGFQRTPQQLRSPKWMRNLEQRVADAKQRAELLRKGGSGLTTDELWRLRRQFQEETVNIPANSRRRHMMAARLFKQYQQSKNTNGSHLNGTAVAPGELATGMVAREKVAVINAGKIELADLAGVLSGRDATAACQKQPAFLIVRFASSLNGNGKQVQQTAVFAQTDAAMKKLRELGLPAVAGKGVLLPYGDDAPTHDAQYKFFVRHLNKYIKVSELYYRNGFAPGGGLEKTIREQAKVLADWGFTVSILGGNEPDAKSYSKELLEKFTHVKIDGAHERDSRTLRIAEELYRGNIPEELYREHLELIKPQLERALKGVDVVIVHNPLFLRNVPMTQALIDLHRYNELPKTTIIGWVHDVGVHTEPHRFPEADKIVPESPWWFADTRFKGIHYIGVSDPVTEKITGRPLENPAATDDVCAQRMPAVPPGSDYIALESKDRVTQNVLQLIDFAKTDQLWVTPGRIADRKNSLGAIEAVALIEGAKLIVSGKPKTMRLPDGTECISDPYFDLLKETVHQLGIEDKVLFLYEHCGEIADNEYEEVLAGLVGLADGTVVLPFEEGFGIDPRNAALRSEVVISSDDPALVRNLGKAARFVPRQAPSFCAAFEMAHAMQNRRNYELRKESRTVATWEQQFSAILPLLGSTPLEKESVI